MQTVSGGLTGRRPGGCHPELGTFPRPVQTDRRDERHASTVYDAELAVTELLTNAA